MEKVIKDVSSKSLHGFRVVEDGNLINHSTDKEKCFTL
jgi:hypothetical protein